MKQAQNARKGRGARGASRKQGKNAEGNRSDNKVRGNPKQLIEKYKAQAREATQAGDRVSAENSFQFADHYQRVLNEMRGLTRGLFSGDYVPVPVEEQSAKTNGEHSRNRAESPKERVASDKAGGDATKEKIPENSGHGSGRSDKADNEKQDIAASGVSYGGEQPREVHPELDLMGQSQTPVAQRRRRPRRTSQNDSGADRPEVAIKQEAAVKPEVATDDEKPRRTRRRVQKNDNDVAKERPVQDSSVQDGSVQDSSAQGGNEGEAA